MTDFRALCAELIDALDSGIPAGRIRMSPLIDRARAELAQPEPEGPTDADLHALAFGFAQPCFDFEYIPFARAVLARWGRPTPQPADGEVAELVAWLRETGDLACQADAEEGQRYWSAADLLERLSTPQPLPVFPEGTQVIEPTERTLLVPVAQPIPVSERLPGPGDCNSSGECWWLHPGDDECGPFWTLCTGRYLTGFTHWLPAHALPVPGEAEK